MRKIVLLAAMLAMVLVAAMPALAQDTDVVGDENVVTNEGDDTQYNAVCQNIIGSIGDITQNQSGAADSIAIEDSAAVAEVAQEQGVTVEQVNECLNNFDADADGFVHVDEIVTGTVTATVVSGGGAAAAAVLPATGGASLFALGAGALLVVGGLLARRIVR